MKKALSLVVLGVALAACGSGSNVVAATVNGQDVTVGDVEALIDSGGEPVTSAQFAQFLGLQIQWLVTADAAEADFDVVVTDEEAAAEADRIYEEVAEEGQSREDFVASRGVTEEVLQNIARQSLLENEIREVLAADVAEPTQEEIDTATEEAVMAQTSVCASHILVETVEEAEDVLTRLEDGEDFGEIAIEVSLDTTSGAAEGALGCASPGGFVEPFAEAVMVAPVGEVYEEIVETEFGFHVVYVTERTEPTEADLPTEEEIVEQLKDQAVSVEVNDWFLSAMEDADVVVVEEYGTWRPNPPTVIPPSETSTTGPGTDGTTTTTIAGDTSSTGG